jgi:CDP-glucose 4,6-dehydratase
MVNIDKDFWENKSVFITGHTGFKGGWLSLWLSQYGAKVHGYSLAPSITPNFYNETNLNRYLTSSTYGDIRDRNFLKESIEKANPEIIFHLAAQPLVRDSYNDPLTTYETNVIGTANLLDCSRNLPIVKSIVVITSDKCYENKEWIWPYRENDTLGGHDPYSSSKACAELLTKSFQQSFFYELNANIATARAGNVIGGGDWAKDRIIPDFFRAAKNNITLNVRSPEAIRPWQHVLEPLFGYQLLAKKLYENNDNYASAWNFGPKQKSIKKVSWIVDYLTSLMPNTQWNSNSKDILHEANILKLDSEKAKELLVWDSKWSIETALKKTVEWQNSWENNEDMYKVSMSQIEEYLS